MTLKDIALECGVSMMTVSNVISGNHKKVSKQTIEKVNAVIKKYDFVPNLMARTLSSKSSHLILLVTPYVKTQELDSIYNQYLTELIASIERELMENSYYVLLRSVYEPKEIEVMYKTWNIDGAIFLLPFFNETIEQIPDYQNKNFVLIDSYADIKGVAYSRCDDYQGCFLATEHLIQNGHKKIIFAAEHEGNLLLEKRFKGYHDALKKHGIDFTPDMCRPIVPNYEGGLKFGRSINRDTLNFTAIVSTSDLCSMGIMRGASENGIKCPDDFSIIGFDNLSIDEFTVPKLTSIDQQISLKGKKAVEQLLNKINKTEKENVASIETKLIERESVKKI